MKGITFLLATVCSFTVALAYEDHYYLDKYLHRLVHFYKSNERIRCNVYGDREVIQNILHQMPPNQTRNLGSPALTQVVNLCSQLETSRLNGKSFASDWQRSIIFPGTKWCGAGNSAETYDDLGLYKETDMCCRDHDHCRDVIQVGETKYGLYNKHVGAISHCDCDDEFYFCLKSQQNKMSDKMGKLFFDVLGQKCFKLDYPIKQCLKYGGLRDLQCQEYELDYTKEKEYQFFDAKLYNV